MKFKLFNKLIVLRNPILLYSLPTQQTVGITNRTEDGYFVLFLDYDNVEYDVVKEDVDFLQKNFNIGTVITRVTREKLNNIVDKEVGNYHVIGFTKFTFPQIREMINLTRCDSHFKVGYKYQSRCWVLRIAEKFNIETQEIEQKSTELKEILVSKTNKVANSGLLRFFELLDKVHLTKHFPRRDRYYEVEFIHYLTQHKRELTNPPSQQTPIHKHAYKPNQNSSTNPTKTYSQTHLVNAHETKS